MSRFSTLGSVDNPLIAEYQSKFILKLQGIWSERFPDLAIPDNEFLLYPDIHNQILFLSRAPSYAVDDILVAIREEWTKYDSGDRSFFANPPEKYIPDTNILLTDRVVNFDINSSNHPSHKDRNIGVTYGSVDPREWNTLFAESFSILRQVSPGFAHEIDHLLVKIIPFDTSYQHHNSGSFSDAIGHLLMSYPTGMDNPELAVLEAILHEYNHNKLNLIMQSENLILNDRREIYYSPYRPDARHIHGIYLGLHALVAAYWVIWNAHVSGILQLSTTWQEKSVLFVLKNGLSLQVLDRYGEFSPLGLQILEEMRSVHQECLNFIKRSELEPRRIANARASLMTHHQEVRINYPHLRD